MKKKEGKILIVDDNEEILFSLEVLLSSYFEKIILLRSPKQIPILLKKEKYDVYILDMNFTANINSGNEGFFWMNEILKYDPDACLIFITAFAGIELAVRAIKDGATDFIEKPWDNRKLLQTVLNAYEIRKSKLKIKELEQKKKELVEIQSLNPNIIRFASPEMVKIYEAVERAAPTDASILLLGENGTGKEVIAKEIHRLSQRANDVFIHVDVGTLNENVIESELFGHVKGAFTDARDDRPGRFEIANGGTIFLDEIGNLPIHLQSKLLSVIQNKQFTRLGSNQYKKVDFRLVCATNINVYEKVDQGLFREDLLYRINTIQIDIPPLRQRRLDIEVFCNHFLSIYGAKYRKTNLKFSEDALKMLIDFDWPGNIRQLEHTIESIVILSDGSTIHSNDLRLKGSRTSIKGLEKENYYDNEKELINLVIQRYNGNLSKAAEMLGIARTTLYRKIKKYDF